jgi:beta-mannosidase
MDGTVLITGHQAVTLAPLASLKLCSEKFTLSPEERKNVVFVAELEHQGQCLARSLATFVPNKHLNLQDPGIKVEVEKKNGELCFNFSAESLARFVELQIPGKDIVFSDNYFDLPAGYSTLVTCPMPAGMTLAQVRKALVVRSLYNSF